jgi:hypothetical protein
MALNGGLWVLNDAIEVAKFAVETPWAPIAGAAVRIVFTDMK